MGQRPLIAIPARFSGSASALRYGAIVTARALSEAVLRAGGEPLTIHPWAPDEAPDPVEVGRRLGYAAGVLLPGGGDLHPATYGQALSSDHVYDVDDEQDTFDIALATWAMSSDRPTLAICRGLQVVNVALGGTLEQHMAEPHRHLVHEVTVEPDTLLADVVGLRTSSSCFHHQRIERIGAGLRPVAHSADGTVEALERSFEGGWFLGVQWHPEDTAKSDSAQSALFSSFVDAARG